MIKIKKIKKQRMKTTEKKREPTSYITDIIVDGAGVLSPTELIRSNGCEEFETQNRPFAKDI